MKLKIIYYLRRLTKAKAKKKSINFPSYISHISLLTADHIPSYEKLYFLSSLDVLEELDEKE